MTEMHRRIDAKRGNAVLVAEEDWKAMQETLISPRFPACWSRSWKGWQHQNPRSVSPLAGELASASPS
ncbi:hypothetical protein [Synechococcus sp. ROS8604]|uniref:hypothetical protein n=1 Tax=Synechococcus sp. ROS8604 TaxID=1442557 RepID=UPI002106AF0D|nr:hypothetical protein [Synechococcus sp. ROS8604]